MHLPRERDRGERGDREPRGAASRAPRARAGGASRSARAGARRLWSTRYGASANASPPASAAPRGSRATAARRGRARRRRRTSGARTTFQRADGPEERVQRPEDEPRTASRRSSIRVGDLGLEAVRVEPRRARRARAGARRARGCSVVCRWSPGVTRPVARRRRSARKLVVRVAKRGRGRERAGGEVERDGERYNARAAASSSSKSGTSPVS